MDGDGAIHSREGLLRCIKLLLQPLYEESKLSKEEFALIAKNTLSVIMQNHVCGSEAWTASFVRSALQLQLQALRQNRQPSTTPQLVLPVEPPQPSGAEDGRPAAAPTATELLANVRRRLKRNVASENGEEVAAAPKRGVDRDDLPTLQEVASASKQRFDAFYSSLPPPAPVPRGPDAAEISMIVAKMMGMMESRQTLVMSEHLQRQQLQQEESSAFMLVVTMCLSHTQRLVSAAANQATPTVVRTLREASVGLEADEEGAELDFPPTTPPPAVQFHVVNDAEWRREAREQPQPSLNRSLIRSESPRVDADPVMNAQRGDFVDIRHEALPRTSVASSESIGAIMKRLKSKRELLAKLQAAKHAQVSPMVAAGSGGVAPVMSPERRDSGLPRGIAPALPPPERMSSMSPPRPERLLRTPQRLRSGAYSGNFEHNAPPPPPPPVESDGIRVLMSPRRSYSNGNAEGQPSTSTVHLRQQRSNVGYSTRNPPVTPTRRATPSRVSRHVGAGAALGRGPSREEVVEYLRGLLQPSYNAGLLDTAVFAELARSISAKFFSKEWRSGTPQLDRVWQGFLERMVKDSLSRGD